MPNEPLPTLYLETTVISYQVARPSRDLVIAAHQECTHRWWEVRRTEYQLFISRLVENEIRKGDPAEVEKRIALIAGLASLEITEDVAELAESFLIQRALPRNAADDAVHIALATTRGIDYLVTWNLKHMANARIRRKIDIICESLGFVPPVICTPEELLGEK
jgi:predicted nucleic acid-binding protein